MKAKKLFALRSNQSSIKCAVECIELNLENIVPEENDRKYMRRYLNEIMELAKDSYVMVDSALEEWVNND